MENIIFDLKEQEYITLVNLLKHKNLVSSGGEVKILLLQEKIKYNGTIEYRKKKKLFIGDIVEVENVALIKIK